jgi:hypothetical protein
MFLENRTPLQFSVVRHALTEDTANSDAARLVIFTYYFTPVIACQTILNHIINGNFRRCSTIKPDFRFIYGIGAANLGTRNGYLFVIH